MIIPGFQLVFTPPNRRRVSSASVVSNDITTFNVTTTTGASNLPFAIAHTFKQGDVPSGSVAALGGDSSLQITPKNYWPDGSLKIAIVAGRKTLTSNVPSTVTIRTGGTVTGGSALTTTDLKNTGITASIAFGAFGTVSWATTDWDTPLETWVSGTEMSSWKYRKAIGADAHAVGWLEVRLYIGGQVEVMAWIENGYLNVASPTSKSGTATFTLGGTSRYSASLDLLNHQRAVLGSGTTWTHWLSTDPGVTPKHNTTYFKATKLIPNWFVDSSASSSLYARLSTSYTPLAQANYETDMTGGGYGAMLGLQPEWDAAYITTNADVRAYRAMIINHLCAGRYGIHFRDETTQKPLSFASYPNLVVGSGSGISSSGTSSTSSYTPAAGGTTPPTWDLAHSPSFGYMPYLVTGWNYFCEESQFEATIGYLKCTDTNRSEDDGIFLSEAAASATRGMAWAIRTLVQAATITPDSDALQTQFRNSWNANIDYYHNRYVTVGSNPLGLVQPYDHYNDNTANLPWQHATFMYDFVIGVWGYAKDLSAEGSTQISKLTAFCSYQYEGIVGRLGPSSAGNFPFTHAEGQYVVYIAPRNDANYTSGAGPWYTNWSDVAVALSIPTAGGNTLTGVSGADPAAMASGQWGNLHPAIAYAVDHGKTGAAAGWARLIGATNYASSASTFVDQPVAAIGPR